MSEWVVSYCVDNQVRISYTGKKKMPFEKAFFKCTAYGIPFPPSQVVPFGTCLAFSSKARVFKNAKQFAFLKYPSHPIRGYTKTKKDGH